MLWDLSYFFDSLGATFWQRISESASKRIAQKELVLLVNRGTMPSLGSVKGVLEIFLSRSPMLWYYSAKSHPHLFPPANFLRPRLRAGSFLGK